MLRWGWVERLLILELLSLIIGGIRKGRLRFVEII